MRANIGQAMQLIISISGHDDRLVQETFHHRMRYHLPGRLEAIDVCHQLPAARKDQRRTDAALGTGTWREFGRGRLNGLNYKPSCGGQGKASCGFGMAWFVSAARASEVVARW